MYPQEIIEKARGVKLVILDVDGVLTNAQLMFMPEGEYKSFNSRDGLGIAMILKEGIELAIISGGRSEAVIQRFKKFGVDNIYQGVDDKSTAYQSLKQEKGFTDDEVAYMGDDLIDLPVMKYVGLPTAVANADEFVQQHAAWISSKNGGEGAVRELCELLLTARGRLDDVRQEFLQ